MKNIIIYLVFFCSFLSYGQENLLKIYRIKIKTDNKIQLKELEPKDTIVIYKNANTTQKEIHKNEFKKVYKDSIISFYDEIKVHNKIVTVYKTEKTNDDFFNNDTINIKNSGIVTDINVKKKFLSNKNGIKGYIKLDDDNKKVIISLVKNCCNSKITIDNKEIERKNEMKFYYDLPFQETLRLSFKEWTVSTLVIPVKYRFKQPNLDEDFSTAVNINFFMGGSWGKTSFYNNGLKTKVNNWKFSGGFISGTGIVILNEGNIIKEKLSVEENNFYADGGSINKGLVSLGFGFTYSFNSINIGIFSGWDYAIGKSSGLWNYDKKPWLGLAIGYDLFKL